MNHPINKAAATLPLVPRAIYTRKSTQASKQPSPTDPLSVWNQSKRILFAVAYKVRRNIRLKLEGHGHAEVEPQELVHDAFIAVMEALPRFHPATAQFTTFVYGLARRRMWLVARAGFDGLSPEQMHRIDTAKRTPRYHHNDSCLRLTPVPTADPEERPSVLRVASIRHRLPPADRRLLDLYLQECGNYAAVARRLGCVPESVRGRYSCLFRRIRAAVWSNAAPQGLPTLMTQSGPDAPPQSVGRVARLSGNVRQPNHVLANEIAGHKAEWRPRAGEEWLAATKYDGVEVKSILINKTKVG